LDASIYHFPSYVAIKRKPKIYHLATLHVS